MRENSFSSRFPCRSKTRQEKKIVWHSSKNFHLDIHSLVTRCKNISLPRSSDEWWKGERAQWNRNKFKDGSAQLPPNGSFLLWNVASRIEEVSSTSAEIIFFFLSFQILITSPLASKIRPTDENSGEERKQNFLFVLQMGTER